MDYIIKHGPHKGKTFDEVDPVELEKYTQEQINEFLRLVEENKEFGKSADYVYNNLLWEREKKVFADDPWVKMPPKKRKEVTDEPDS